MSLATAIICVSAITVFNIAIMILKHKKTQKSIGSTVELAIEVIFFTIYAFVGLIGIMYLYESNQMLAIISFSIWALIIIFLIFIILRHYCFNKADNLK